jgi:hypothetical protein
MNHTIKGIIIVAAITSMLVVGLSMVPITQNSFAHKKEKGTSNTNINSADSSSTSTATASNTNNINNTNAQAQNNAQAACLAVFDCDVGSSETGGD